MIFKDFQDSDGMSEIWHGIEHDDMEAILHLCIACGDTQQFSNFRN